MFASFSVMHVRQYYYFVHATSLNKTSYFIVTELDPFWFCFLSGLRETKSTFLLYKFISRGS